MIKKWSLDLMYFRLIKISLLFLLWFSTSTAKPSDGAIKINEVLAASTTSIIDPHYRQYSDWIELYNPGEAPVDLSGYFLTNDFSQPAKWQFPTQTHIKPDDYLLIWADSMNDTLNGLHTNFKLNSDGDFVGLFNNNGRLCDSLTFAQQLTNISFGREINTNDKWLYFEKPTPGRANTSLGLARLIQAQEPVISHSSGFYHGQQNITISAPRSTVILYTTDGSTPSRTSPRYSEPIPIKRTTVLKVRGYQRELLPGPVVTRTFFIDAEGTLPVISLSTDGDNLWHSKTGIYLNKTKTRRNWQRPAFIEYFEPNSGLAFSGEANIRLHGDTALEIPQKALNVSLASATDYPIFGFGKTLRLESFILGNSGDDWRLTMLRDVFIQTLFGRSLSLDTQEARQAVLFINGDYWGIHNILENFDADYISNYYPANGQNIDLIQIAQKENSVELLAGDLEHYNALTDFISVNSLAKKNNYDVVAGMIDIENFLDFVIAQALIGNSNWEQNITAWRPHTPDGKWRWLVSNCDQGYRDVEFNTLEEMSHRFPLFTALLQNQTFRQTLLNKFTDHLNNIFVPDRTVAIFDSTHVAIAEEMSRHIERWAGVCNNGTCGIASREDWENNVSAMREIIRERPAIVRQLLMDFFDTDEPVQLEVNIQQPGFGKLKIDKKSFQESNFSGLFFKGASLQLKAQANAGYEFLGWRENISSALPLIAQGSDWKYYDRSNAPEPSWKLPGFDDSGWRSNKMQFATHGGDESAPVDNGAISNDKHYLRKTFQVAELSGLTGLSLKLLQNNTVVYLNGGEVVRTNPSEIGGFDMAANSPIVTGGDTFMEFFIPPDNLVEGENILAVEIYQDDKTATNFYLQLDGIYGEEKRPDFISTEPELNLRLKDDVTLTALFSAKTSNQLPAKITEDMVLTRSNSPYIATRMVTVGPDVTLTIKAGVNIQLNKNASLVINGNLIASGSHEEPIIFQGIGDSSWGGLFFENTTDKSTLLHVTIKGATQGPDSLHSQGAISTFNAAVVLDHVTMENMQRAFFGSGGMVAITNSSLDGSKTNHALIAIEKASIKIENTNLLGNGMALRHVDEGIISDNRIDISGTHSRRDGISISGSQNVLIQNNQVFGSTGKGVSISENSTALLKGNLLIKTGIAVAVKDNSIAIIDHNTFYNDSVGVACYEETTGLGGGHAVVTNTIFAESYATDFSSDAVSSIQISYSLSDKTKPEGVGNIHAYPLFVSEAARDFSLQEASPCIDSGAPDSPKDADSTRTDIGALPYYFGPANISEIYINEFMAENRTTITDETGAYKAWIEIYNGGETEVDIGGLYLSNDSTDYTLWRIPTDAPEITTIAPGDFLVIWADEDSNESALHAGFRLRADSGQITLVRKDKSGTVVVDSVIYGQQTADISFGRRSDGADLWQTFSTPSPGANNIQANKEIIAAEESELPDRFVVHQNYPNPFNPVTTITFELPEGAHVSVDVFNAIGQKVSQLFQGVKPAGIHQVEWNGRFDDGYTASSGIYFYKVVAGGKSFVHKMVLMR